MPKILIDSSVYISYFGSDSNTPQSLVFWERISSKDVKVTSSSLVTAETMIILSQQKIPNLPMIYDKLKQIETTSLDDEFLELLVNYVTKNRRFLKSSDLIIVFTAKLHSATLITWDKRLLDNQICPTLTPSQYI